jgi:CRISPR system Cascade subunit CasA
MPRDPAAVAASYGARTLSLEAARAEVQSLAPKANWDGRHWDRLSLFAIAMVNNPTIVEARAKAASAARALKAARVPPAATLTLTSEYANDPGATSPWLYGATLDVPLDIGAARISRVGAATFAARSAHYDYMEAVWSVRMALRRAVAARLLAAREVEISAALAQTRELQRAAAERRAAAGETSRTEFARVSAEASADSRRLTDARARLAAADSALAAALGVPSVALQNLDVSWADFDAPATPEAATLAAAKQAAVLGRADILRAASAYDHAESNLRAEVARQFPGVQIGPGYTWERGLVKLPFTLALVLPPLDLNRAAIRAAEAGRSEAGAHLEASVVQAVSAVDMAIAEHGAAQAALAKVRDVELPAAQKQGRQADDAFAAGEIDRAEWGASKALAQQGELAALDALRRAQEAQAALEDALRRPLEGPELAIDGTALTGANP